MAKLFQCDRCKETEGDALFTTTVEWPVSQFQKRWLNESPAVRTFDLCVSCARAVEAVIQRESILQPTAPARPVTLPVGVAPSGEIVSLKDAPLCKHCDQPEDAHPVYGDPHGDNMDPPDLLCATFSLKDDDIPF